MHQFGGECQAFKEEDLRMQIEKEKKKQEEVKRREIEEKKRREAEKQRELELIKRKKEMERQFEDNFNVNEDENERGGVASRGIHDRIPKTNEVKPG